MDCPDLTPSRTPATHSHPSEENFELLGRGECDDLTQSLDLANCHTFPYSGDGLCDLYRGALERGPKVAIKSMRIYTNTEPASKQEILKRASRELYYWSRLKHPNVLPLLGLANFRGQISMVSEWMANGNLLDYLRPVPAADRIKPCMDVCEALCYIHDLEIAHGDLKAANILVSSNGVPVLTDLGNAFLRNTAITFSDTAVRGASVRWAAPELILKDGAALGSQQADVYAYGMTVLEVLTGKVPYEGHTDRQVFKLVVYEKKLPPRPEQNINDDLWDMLMSCWAREPPKRPRIGTINNKWRAKFPCTIQEHHRTLRREASPTPSKKPIKPNTREGRGEREEIWDLMVNYFVPNRHVYAWNSRDWSIYLMNEELQRAGEIIPLPAVGEIVLIDDVQYRIDDYEELVRLTSHGWVTERLYSTFYEAIQQAKSNARGCRDPESDALSRWSLNGFPSVAGPDTAMIAYPVQLNQGAHEYYEAGPSSTFPSGSLSNSRTGDTSSELPFLIDGLPPTMESINRFIDRLKSQRASITCPVPGCQDKDKEQRRIHALRDHLCSHFNIRAYTCPRCSKGFITKTNCDRHVGTCRV